ncbi:MAG: SulP family inorganic anion transporter [Gemmataceae bacterium]|nr:SulP family inorganic anion transporter [Gemmataceae bacterium]
MSDEQTNDDVGPPPASAMEWVFLRVPALDSLRTYSWRSLRLDLFAGLTVAAIAVPQAMAYASIAQIPVQYGLYTAIIMTAVGALFDSSRQLINGPTNAICIALASALVAFEKADDRLAAAILMALLIGIFQIAITLFRLGDLSRFISHSVIVGFTLGAAVLLALDQSRNFLGLPRAGEHDDHFLVRYFLTMRQMDQISYRAVALGSATIALVVAFYWFGVWMRVQLPGFLIVVVLAAAAVWYLDWDQGPQRVEVIGFIPSHLPAPEVPTISWPMIRQLLTGSLAIAVLGLIEAVAMAKAIASRTHQKLDINQQCLSEGLANLVGSFFQCFPGSGSLTRSAINVQAGAVSQWSGVVAAAAVALTVVLFAPLAYYIPRAALAGILLVSAWRLVDRKQLMYHLRTTRFDMKIVLVTAVSAIAINIEFCILIGIFLSVVLYVGRAARLELTELTMTPEHLIRERAASDPRCDRILIYNLEGELFFGSAPDLERHFETIEAQAQPATRVIVLRVKRVRNPDAVCLEVFDRLIDRLRERGIQVILCGVRKDFARVIRSSGLEAKLGKEYLFREKEVIFSATLDAVRFAYELLKGDHCADCPRRGEGRQDVLYYMI